MPVAILTELVTGDVYQWGALMAGSLLGSLPVAHLLLVLRRLLRLLADGCGEGVILAAPRSTYTTAHTRPKLVQETSMPKFRIVTPAAASFTTAGGGYAYEMEALENIDAEIVECPATQEAFIAAARDADAVYAKGMQFNAQMIHALDKCRLIALGSVGVDYVDVAAATEKGIPVTNCPRHLHRGGGGPRHDAAAGHPSPGRSSRIAWCARPAGERAGRSSSRCRG